MVAVNKVVKISVHFQRKFRVLESQDVLYFIF